MNQRKKSKKIQSITRIETLRASYAEHLKHGVGEFFESKTERCPWCGSCYLRQLFETTDLFQHKPGRFTLDECRVCQHVFQNPRLNEAGLEFYYRDFYDGLGEEGTDFIFAKNQRVYQKRAKMLAPFAAPETWLDVGTGHGHFCETARRAFPQTVFHGSDLSDGIEIAERYGRVELGHRATLRELSTRYPDNYDVVSMYHYLEHSVDPQSDLEAAHDLLRPGGYLTIEMPDPDCWYARLLGRWWLPWFQPQHLQLIPLENLRRRLEYTGFTVVATQHVEPHSKIDLLAAVYLMLDAIAPQANKPWFAKPPSRRQKALRTAVLATALPVLLAAALADWLVRPVSGWVRLASAYRVLARREGSNRPEHYGSWSPGASS